MYVYVFRSRFFFLLLFPHSAEFENVYPTFKIQPVALGRSSGGGVWRLNQQGETLHATFRDHETIGGLAASAKRGAHS